MARDISTAMQVAIAAASLRPFILVEAEFQSGTLRLWTGYGDLSWNGQIWTGAGQLMAIGNIEETNDIRAAGVQISLSGMPASLISTALGQARHGKLGKIYLGAMDASGTVIADPQLSFEGRLDVPVIDDFGENCTITISYENRLIDLERARERRFTHEDQQAFFPGDLGFEFVAGLQEKEIVWTRRE